MPRGGLFDFYWARIAKWCLLGCVVMLLWLLAPVVQCSWGAFRDTPISEARPTIEDPAVADSERLREGQGFWSKFTTSVGRCYARTPLFGQEAWKENLLVGFAAAWLIARLLAYLDLRRRRTFDH